MTESSPFFLNRFSDLGINRYPLKSRPKKTTLAVWFLNGALDRNRTYDLPIRNRLLYPAELPVRIVPRKRENPLIPRSLRFRAFRAQL